MIGNWSKHESPKITYLTMSSFAHFTTLWSSMLNKIVVPLLAVHTFSLTCFFVYLNCGSSLQNTHCHIHIHFNDWFCIIGRHIFPSSPLARFEPLNLSFKHTFLGTPLLDRLLLRYPSIYFFVQTLNLL